MNSQESLISLIKQKPLLAGFCCTALFLVGCSKDNDSTPGDNTKFQVRKSDQSNSVTGVEGAGTRGSFLWIWESAGLETQISDGTDAPTLSCLPASATIDVESTGPCDLLDVLPQSLVEINANGNATGQTLGDLDGFGQLHGMLADPENRYVTASIFAPAGGFVGFLCSRMRQIRLPVVIQVVMLPIRVVSYPV